MCVIVAVAAGTGTALDVGWQPAGCTAGFNTCTLHSTAQHITRRLSQHNSSNANCDGCSHLTPCTRCSTGHVNSGHTQPTWAVGEQHNKQVTGAPLNRRSTATSFAPLNTQLMVRTDPCWGFAPAAAPSRVHARSLPRCPDCDAARRPEQRCGSESHPRATTQHTKHAGHDATLARAAAADAAVALHTLLYKLLDAHTTAQHSTPKHTGNATRLVTRGSTCTGQAFHPGRFMSVCLPIWAPNPSH